MYAMVIGAGRRPAVTAVVPISSSGRPASMDSATGIIVRRFQHGLPLSMLPGPRVPRLGRLGATFAAAGPNGRYCTWLPTWAGVAGSASPR